MLRSGITMGRTTLIALTAITVLFHLLIIVQAPSWFGYFLPHQSLKAVSLIMAVLLIFMIPHMPEGEIGTGSAKLRLSYADAALWLCLTVSCGYVIFFHDAIEDYGFYGELDTQGIILALMLALPLLEAVRRKTGPVLPGLILMFVAIAMFQQYLPGVLHGQGYPLSRLLLSTYAGDSGIFGRPLGIAVNIVIVFLVFGALMDRAGASRWFMDIALAATGWARGGPAKSAVVASALFGSISGSPSGNSATTGVFTIPMMLRAGYTPQFAAAVEAVASTGGMILPPVMGAIAFLMAEWIGRTYLEVVIAAIIPGALYYLIIFASVHFEARRSGMQPTPRAEMPRLWTTVIGGWYYFIPVLALIYFLVVAAYPPGMAGIYASLAVIASSFLSKDRSHWLLPMPIILALREAVLRWLVIVVITGAVGIMIGALELSGVGINVSRFIIDLGGGNVVVTLVLVGIVSLIVGMGLDATPAYVTLATLLAPALVQLGVPDIAAHLYVIYWGMASFFTPPTCIAIFVTAPIAGAPIWSTGWEAMRVGIAAFLVPIAFALNPALLMEGDVSAIVQAAGTAFLGSVCLAAGLRGFGLRPMRMLSRVLISAGGVLLIAPGLWLAACGIALAAVATILSYLFPQEEAPGKAGTSRVK